MENQIKYSSYSWEIVTFHTYIFIVKNNEIAKVYTDFTDLK